MQNGNNNINQLLSLNQKVLNHTATQKEIDDYMYLLYKNGSITQKQYSDFKEGRNVEDIIKAGLIIGGIVLLGYAIGKLFD